jgi:hypothetical protein
MTLPSHSDRGIVAQRSKGPYRPVPLVGETQYPNILKWLLISRKKIRRNTPIKHWTCSRSQQISGNMFQCQPHDLITKGLNVTKGCKHEKTVSQIRQPKLEKYVCGLCAHRTLHRCCVAISLCPEWLEPSDRVLYWPTLTVYMDEYIK